MSRLFCCCKKNEALASYYFPYSIPDAVLIKNKDQSAMQERITQLESDRHKINWQNQTMTPVRQGEEIDARVAVLQEALHRRASPSVLNP